jgi:hypothetical protein
MRLVEWKDEKGWKHLSWIRDDDPDEMAPRGIKADPPDIEQLEWGQIKRELHNSLVNRRLVTWKDVQQQKEGIKGAVLGVLRRRIVNLYKNK